MRKLVLILIAFIAVITFIRAFDGSRGVYPEDLHAGEAAGLSENIIIFESEIEAASSDQSSASADLY